MKAPFDVIVAAESVVVKESTSRDSRSKFRSFMSLKNCFTATVSNKGLLAAMEKAKNSGWKIKAKGPQDAGEFLLEAKRRRSGEGCDALKVVSMLMNIWYMDGFKAGNVSLDKQTVYRRKKQLIQVTFSVYGAATEEAKAKFGKYGHVTIMSGEAAVSSQECEELMSE